MVEWGKMTKWKRHWAFAGAFEATRKIDGGWIRAGAGKTKAGAPDRHSWFVDLHPWPTEREETPETQRIAMGFCTTMGAAKRCAEIITNDAERMIELMGSTNTTAKD